MCEFLVASLTLIGPESCPHTYTHVRSCSSGPYPFAPPPWLAWIFFCIYLYIIGVFSCQECLTNADIITDSHITIWFHQPNIIFFITTATSSLQSFSIIFPWFTEPIIEASLGFLFRTRKGAVIQEKGGFTFQEERKSFFYQFRYWTEQTDPQNNNECYFNLK